MPKPYGSPVFRTSTRRSFVYSPAHKIVVNELLDSNTMLSLPVGNEVDSESLEEEETVSAINPDISLMTWYIQMDHKTISEVVTLAEVALVRNELEHARQSLRQSKLRSQIARSKLLRVVSDVKRARVEYDVSVEEVDKDEMDVNKWRVLLDENGYREFLLPSTQ